jgi:hypothetical protein
MWAGLYGESRANTTYKPTYTVSLEGSYDRLNFSLKKSGLTALPLSPQAIMAEMAATLLQRLLASPFEQHRAWPRSFDG